MKRISVVLIVLSLLFVCSCGGGGGSGVPPTEQEISELLETQNSAKQFYEELEAVNDPTALQKTVDFLKERENVEDAAIGDDNVSIWIKYISGVEAIILTKFGSVDSGSSPRLKMDELFSEDYYRSLAQESGKRAIILLPIDSMPNYQDESADDIEFYLKQSGYSVEIYRDQSVTLELMKTLSDYNLIYMASHGGVGFMDIGWNVQIMTGEIANANVIAEMWNLLRAGATSGLTLFLPAGSDNTYFGLNCNFFDDYTYPGSFVYMNACSSLKEENLADAFLDNGASIFIGWDNHSFLALGNFHNPEFFNHLAEPNTTFKDAFDATIALYYPCSIYKDDNRNRSWHVLFYNGQDEGDKEDTNFDYILNLRYRGNYDFILNEQNTPPTAAITSPTGDSVFSQGAEIAFVGSGNDPEEGELTGERLVWVSDKDGPIGTGRSFTTAALSVNTHTITLTAADSKGLTDSDQISITIAAGEEQEEEEEEPSTAEFCLTHFEYPEYGFDIACLLVSLTATPLFTVAQGESVVIPVFVRFSEGSVGSVYLTSSGLPEGTESFFNPDTFLHDGMSEWKITANYNAAPGFYPLLVSGTDGENTKGLNYKLAVSPSLTTPFDFSLSLEPSSGSMSPSGICTINVSVTLTGSSKLVYLSASGLSDAAIFLFSPDCGFPPFNAELSINTTLTAPPGLPSPGTYPITIFGIGGGLKRSAIFQLTIL